MNDAEKLHTLVFYNLFSQVPILSGNMASMIHTSQAYGTEFVIVIDAPFYDVKEWEKNRTVVHTGQVIDGKTAYAEWVNKLGGFGTRNKSMYWVNRVCVEAATVLASEIGAEVINELELWR